MRFIVLFRLLICVALALQGVASAQVVANPCAMTESAEVSMAGHPCCNDDDTRSTTGKPCKSGQECPPVQALGVVPGAVLPVPRVVSLRPADPPGSDSFDAPAVWRPPILS